MGFKDDYEYYDDDDYNDEDDEEYLDYSEDSSRSRGGSPLNKGGLPGSGASRFGGRIGARSDGDDDDDEDDDDALGSRLGGSSRFSSGSRFGSSGSGSLLGGSDKDKKDDDSSSANRFSSGSRFSSSSGSSGGTNRFSSGSSSGSGTSRFGSGSSGDDKKDEDKASTNRFGTSDSRFSSGSRFSSSTSSGSGTSRFGSGSSGDDKKDEDKSSTNRFGSQSRFGSGSAADDKKDDKPSSGSSFGVNRFGSGSGSSSDKKDDDKSSSNRFGVNRFGSGSSSDKKDDDKSSSNRFSSSSGSSRFGSSSSSSTTSDKKDDDKSSSNRFSSSSGSSRFGNSSSSSTTSDKKDDNKSSSSRFGSSSDKKDDKKASAATKDAKKEDSGGGMFGSLKSRFGGGDDKKDGKKDDKSGSASAIGGLLGGITSAIGSKTGGDKKDSGGASSMFGGLKNRFGGGDDKKPDAKKDDKKPDASGSSSGSRFGNLGNRFGSQSADKKDDKKPDNSAKSSFSPFGKKDDKPADSSAKPSFGGFGKKDDKPADKKDEGDKKPAQSPFGRFGRTQSSDAKSDDKAEKSSTGRTKATAKDGEESGGIFGRISASVGGIFNRGEKKSSSRTKKPKVPTTSSDDGLTLDNWLDILGVGLVFTSLVLFFSAISRDQAAISRVHVTIGQLFGWGALAVPITMFVIGMWLIVRHFGDEAPTISPIRVAGIILGFVSLLVIFQYIDSFNYTDISVPNNGEISRQLLESRLYQAWYFDQSGGGIVGAQLYFFLVTTMTELGGFLLILFVSLISLMLITRLSAAEILTAIAGVGMAFREWTQNEAERRRAERQLAAQKAAELAYQQQMQQVQQPVAEAAPVQQQPVAQADATAEDRSIRINLGGQTLPTANVASNLPQPTVPQPQHKPATSGGLFSRLRGNKSETNNQGGTIATTVGSLFSMGNNGQNTNAPTPPPLPESPLPMDDGYSHLDYMPPRPAAQTSNPNTIKLGDLLKPPPPPTPQSDDAVYGTNGTSQTPPAPSAAEAAPQQPAASTAPMAAPEDIDPVKARQERLNALRQGKAGPLSQAAMAQARKEDTPETRGIPIGRDAQTPPTSAVPRPEFTPPSQLPSAQPDGTSGLHQQRLSEPVSSQVVNQTRPRADWRLPDYRTLLSSGSEQEFDREYLLKQAKIIEETLEAFGAPGRVVEVNTGPVITQFGVEPDYVQGRNNKKQRVKVGAIAALDKDLQLALGAKSIRVEAPVPGKGYVGVEVPNAEPTLVSLRDVMDSPSFAKHKSPLAIALGQSVSGAPISADLANMPHLLIAGTTGSGKSVCVNSIIASILALNTPDVVKFIMVDPKRVELTGYNGVPHLVAPVVVELERIVGVLKWVTREMDERYKKFSEAGARNIEDYNKHRDPTTVERMPYIIVIIDELADLMMLAPEETERTVTRIAALARATGIHLVIATQRPSVDVVTGLIKANFPARIAFAVAGGVDSRVILDQPGAERLLGRGDMLYLSGDSPAPLRLQGVFVSDMEINNIVRYWKMQSLKQPEPQPIALNPTYKPATSAGNSERVTQQAFWDSSNAPTPAAVARQAPAPALSRFSGFDDGDDDDDYDDDDGELTEEELTGDVEDGNEDDLYEKAVELVRRLDKASISLLQRRLRIGYTRAARLIDVMEARGVVGPSKDGSSKPRDVLPE